MEESGREACLDELDEDDSDAEGEEEEYEDDGEEATDEEDDEDAAYLSSFDKTNGNVSENQSHNATVNAFSFNQYLDVTASSLDDSSILFAENIERPNTIETFCNTPNPTEAMFTALEDVDKVTAFQTYINSIDEKDFLPHLVFAVLKCSAISTQNPEAAVVATTLYKQAYDYAVKTNQVMRVNNFFLTQLGLLKAEDKTFVPVHDLKACRAAIKTAISEKALPTEAASIFNLFLEVFP